MWGTGSAAAYLDFVKAQSDAASEGDVAQIQGEGDAAAMRASASGGSPKGSFSSGSHGIGKGIGANTLAAGAGVQGWSRSRTRSAAAAGLGGAVAAAAARRGHTSTWSGLRPAGSGRLHPNKPNFNLEAGARAAVSAAGGDGGAPWPAVSGSFLAGMDYVDSVIGLLPGPRHVLGSAGADIGASTSTSAGRRRRGRLGAQGNRLNRGGSGSGIGGFGGIGWGGSGHGPGVVGAPVMLGVRGDELVNPRSMSPWSVSDDDDRHDVHQEAAAAQETEGQHQRELEADSDASESQSDSEAVATFGVRGHAVAAPDVTAGHAAEDGGW